MPASPAHDRQLMAWSADLDRPATVRAPVPSCEGCGHFELDTVNPAFWNLYE